MLKYYFSTCLIFLNIWFEILKTILMNGEVESVTKIPDLIKIIAQAEEYLWGMINLKKKKNFFI